MTYSVMVENRNANHYTATVIGWPSCVAEGSTREDAIMRVKQRFAKQLKQVEIVPIEVEPSSQDEQATLDEHPWAQFAGMYDNNP